SFFFSSRRRHTRSYGEWRSDVCSADLVKVSRRPHRQQHGWRLTRHSHRATGPVWLTTQLPVFHGDIEITQESSSVNRNLVQVIRSVKVRSALPDVANFHNEMLRKLALNGQIPLVDRGILDV